MNNIIMDPISSFPSCHLPKEHKYYHGKKEIKHVRKIAARPLDPGFMYGLE